MKLESKSPRGKALVSLIKLTAKHPSMLDRKTGSHELAHAKKLHTPKHEVDPTHELESESEPELLNEEAPSHSDHGLEGVMEESPLTSEKKHEEAKVLGAEEHDLDSAQHNHDEDDCGDNCPVRIAVKQRLGRR